MPLDPRSKSFFLRMTPADLDMLNGIAEDEQRPYTQVAALLMHAALIGYGRCPRGMSVLQYCERLEAGGVGESVRRPLSTVTTMPATGIRRVAEGSER